MRPPLLPCSLLFSLALALLVGCQDSGQYRPYRAAEGLRSLELGGTTLTVEIAADLRSRERGLMHRNSMPEDHGMLFMYPTATMQNFWMKNTFIKLSIAFIDKDGTIVNIEDMEPMTLRPGAASHAAVPYALEVVQGWFDKHGIKAGDKITLPDWIEEINPQA